jgi:alkylation response protein AidB-like acyl-CoA dehydrogenase
MVDIFATDKLRKAYPEYQQFIALHLYPLERQLLSIPFSEASAILEEKRTLARAMGLWAPYLPAEEGHIGLTMLEFAQISELLATTPYGHYVFNCQAPDIGNIELLHRHASDEQKQRYLKPLTEGAIRSCFSMTEPGHAGSNPLLMSTTAARDGDEWVINGRKWFTTAADGASFAVVMAITDTGTPKYERASMIIVPTNTPGFNLVRNIPVLGDTGDGYHSHSEIEYKDCRVPAANLLGAVGSGFRLAQERLGPGRIHHCMRWIGICERALDLMCRRAVERDMGDGQLLADKQTIQHWIAESRAEINASRYLVLHTAEMLDRLGAKAVRNEISAIKFFVADVLGKVLDRSVQAHGALGLTDATPLSYWYRHERGARIYDGPDEVHKSALARSVLKPYLNLQDQSVK